MSSLVSCEENVIRNWSKICIKEMLGYAFYVCYNTITYCVPAALWFGCCSFLYYQSSWSTLCRISFFALFPVLVAPVFLKPSSLINRRNTSLFCCLSGAISKAHSLCYWATGWVPPFSAKFDQNFSQLLFLILLFLRYTETINNFTDRPMFVNISTEPRH